MILTDQPTCFARGVTAAVSSRQDGVMLNRTLGVHAPEIVENRRAFCRQNRINYDDVVYHCVVYGAGRSYDLIAEVDDGATSKITSELVADGLFTRAPGVGLLLPVADCVATVLYDPQKNFLALLHLGRHSTIANLMARMVDKFIHEGSSPKDIIVWMSPSAQKETYIMEYFDHANDPNWQGFCEQKADGWHINMQGYNAAVCQKMGISAGNIHISPINTMTDRNYFSHAGDKTLDRFAVAAMMR